MHTEKSVCISLQNGGDYMFVWDFIMGDVLDQMIEWCYGQVVGGLVDFFGIMGNMGVELFDMKWVQSIVLFFSYLGWSLFGSAIINRTENIRSWYNR